MACDIESNRKRKSTLDLDGCTARKRRMLWSPQSLVAPKANIQINPPKSNNITASKVKKNQVAWRPQDLVRRDRIFELMKPPEINRFKVVTLISTTQSALWMIRNYVSSDIGIKHFSPLSLVSNPKFELYEKVCTSRRSMRFLGIDELNGIIDDIENEDERMSKRIILDILLRLCKDFGFDFNSALLNLYQNGEEYVGNHSDKEVLPGHMVAGVAFGATRKFRIRDKMTGKIVLDVPHHAGNLLIMAGNFQNEFRHEIPVQKTVKSPRLSITFRHRTEEAISRHYVSK